jgi:predicted nucleic acid-binding protein
VALWHRLAKRDTASPKVWMDAYLAAFAISSGLCFVTLDDDFKTYEAQGLDWVLLNP